MKPLKLDTAITADRVVDVLKQLEEEHDAKLKAWEKDRQYLRRQPPRVEELAERLGISRVGLNPFLKQLRAEHRVEIYKHVGEHNRVASIGDDARNRALAADARRREIAVLREQTEAWVQAHDHEPIFDVTVRMGCDEAGLPIPGRSTVEITTSCDDVNILSLLEVLKNMGGRSADSAWVICDSSGKSITDGYNPNGTEGKEKNNDDEGDGAVQEATPGEGD